MLVVSASPLVATVVGVPPPPAEPESARVDGTDPCTPPAPDAGVVADGVEVTVPLGAVVAAEGVAVVVLTAAVVVVTGATALNLPVGVTRLPNPEWERGLANSLQVAVHHAREAGHDSIVVGLGDQPLVTPEAWRRVAQADSPIAVATYDGTRGNPVKLEAATWAELPTTGDEGARPVMRAHPGWVVEVPCTGSAFDVDTTQDLEKLAKLQRETDD